MRKLTSFVAVILDKSKQQQKADCLISSCNSNKCYGLYLYFNLLFCVYMDSYSLLCGYLQISSNLWSSWANSEHQS